MKNIHSFDLHNISGGGVVNPEWGSECVVVRDPKNSPECPTTFNEDWSFMRTLMNGCGNYLTWFNKKTGLTCRAHEIKVSTARSK